MALTSKVGSFTKATGAAPASQVITGVGFQPKALLLFTAGETSANTYTASHRSGIGFSTGASNAKAISYSEQNGAATTNSSQRMAAKALTIVQYGETLLAECDLTSFDSDGFTLSWTTNNATAYEIGYMALGGPDLTNAFAATWQATSSAGSVAITGVGFTPDCIVVAHLGDSGSGSIPFTDVYSDISVGAAVRGSTQWSCQTRTADGFASAQAWNSFYPAAAAGVSAAATFFEQSLVASFDSDGFTMQYITSVGGSRAIALCLKGGNYVSGYLPKTTGSAPATQILNLPFTPSGILLASPSTTNFNSPAAPGRFGFGATDGASGAGFTTTSTYSGGASVAFGNFTTGALSQANNDVGTEDAKLAVPSLAGPQITLSWTPNNATAAWIGYLAIGNTSFTPPSGGGGGAWAFSG